MKKNQMNAQTKQHDNRPVACYSRVSTRIQFQEGASIEAQKSVLERASALFAPGRKIVFFIDQGSGRNTRRPEYSALLADIRRDRFSMLLAYSTDRLSRNTGDFHRLLQLLESKHVALYLHNLGVASFTPVGKLMLSMLSAVGEFESEQIAARTKVTIQHLASMKKKGPGKRPFGWQVDSENNLVEDPNEQRVIMLANNFRNEGWSWKKISDYMNQLSIRPAESKNWDEYKIRQSVSAANRRIQAIAEVDVQRGIFA